MSLADRFLCWFVWIGATTVWAAVAGFAAFVAWIGITGGNVLNVFSGTVLSWIAVKDLAWWVRHAPWNVGHSVRRSNE
jgi:hypothetical protein